MFTEAIPDAMNARSTCVLIPVDPRTPETWPRIAVETRRNGKKWKVRGRRDGAGLALRIRE
jgi:hypothetical protein